MPSENGKKPKPKPKPEQKQKPKQKNTRKKSTIKTKWKIRKGNQQSTLYCLRSNMIIWRAAGGDLLFAVIADVRQLQCISANRRESEMQ